MANLGAALKAHLEADATVSGLVSDRIFPGVAPTDAALPYITYEQISDPTIRHMLAANGISRATYQIDCWARQNTETYTLADAVREAIDGFLRGTWGTVNVVSVTIRNIRDDLNQPDDASQDVTQRRWIEASIVYHRSVPTFS